MIDSTTSGDRAMEILDADGRVQYVRGNRTGDVTRLSCYRRVSGALTQYSPILGLSNGQAHLACCVLSLATHPDLTA